MDGKNFFTTWNRFWSIQTMRSEIKAREIALFSLLISAAGKQGWPDRFEASTTAICQALGCKRQSFTRSRQRLRECGVIEYTEGTRGQKAAYKFPFVQPMLRKVDAKCVESVTPSTKKERNKESRGEIAAAALSFEEIVAQVEKEFPRRSDVRKLAERMAEKDGTVTAYRLKHWLRGEKHPEYKAPEPEPEPEGWQEKFRFEYPDAVEPGPWPIFKQKHPEIARRYTPKND